MKKGLTFEDMADSLVLTACDERLKILKEVEERVRCIIGYREGFTEAYDYVHKMILEEKNKIFGFNRLLFKANYIDADEYFRLMDDTQDKFETIEKNFVKDYVAEYYIQHDE